MAKTKKIIARVKSYEDACKQRGYSPATIESFSFLPEGQRKATFAHHQLITIVEALNEGHVFDWNNDDEYKYYPWFDLETYGDNVPGSGFRFLVCDFGTSHSHVGARLCYRSQELAEYAGNQFLDLYRDLMKQ